MEKVHKTNISWRDLFSLIYPLIYHSPTQSGWQASLGCDLPSKLINGKCWERELSSLDHHYFLDWRLSPTLLQVPHRCDCIDLLPSLAGDWLCVHCGGNHPMGQRDPWGLLWPLPRASLCQAQGEQRAGSTQLTLAQATGQQAYEWAPEAAA